MSFKSSMSKSGKREKKEGGRRRTIFQTVRAANVKE